MALISCALRTWVSYCVLFAGGVSQLETLVDGVSSQNESFAVGVNVTYICRVQAILHIWSIQGPLSITESISFGVPVAIEPPFTIRPLSQTGTSLTSSLSFKTYIGLNGTAISCAGPLNTDEQEITVMVEGKFIYST